MQASNTRIIMDSSTQPLSPNKSVHSIVLDTAQHRLGQQQHRARLDAMMVVLGESQETLAGINLSPNHLYSRRRRRQQGSCQDFLDNLKKQVPSSSSETTKQVQRTRNPSYSHKKSVRFGNDDDHQVQTIDPIDRKYRDQLYWTEPQLIQLQLSAKRVVKHYSSDKKKPYVAAIHRILQSHKSTTPGSGATNNDVVQVLCESAARGLESGICPMLKYYRKRSVRTVLALQCELRMSGEHADSAAHLLRNRSLAASRPCRHLARQLALGDVAAAHINGPSESASSSPMMTLPTPSVWLQEQHSAIVEA